MRKHISIFLPILFSYSFIASADFKPIVSVALGVDNAAVYKTSTNVSFISPFYNSYAGNNAYDTQIMGGVFLGGAYRPTPVLESQIGVSYYGNAPYETNGVVYQFGNPSFNDVGYSYGVVSHRVLLETKLLYLVKKVFHPYIDVGVGEAFNVASTYGEYAIVSTGVPTAYPFQSHTTDHFAYMVGGGLDMDVSQHVRMGLGYRYVNMGNAALGTSSAQIDSTVLKNTSLTNNEYLFQVTLI